MRMVVIGVAKSDEVEAGGGAFSMRQHAICLGVCETNDKA